jgi:hypothetical protein
MDERPAPNQRKSMAALLPDAIRAALLDLVDVAKRNAMSSKQNSAQQGVPSNGVEQAAVSLIQWAALHMCCGSI